MSEPYVLGEIRPDNPWVRRGDVLGVASTGFFGKRIRSIKRGESTGERTTHVGIITQDGFLRPRDASYAALVTEALVKPGVVTRNVLEAYSGKDIWISRPVNVSDKDIEVMMEWVAKQVGKKYGYGKVALHALGLERWIFRESVIICSYLVTMAYKQVNLDFGVPAKEADPADMERFSKSNQGKQAWIARPSWLPGLVFVS